jgi:uncharacterized protein DUF3306
MSGDEPFLTRWSRRKRIAAARLQAKEHPPAGRPRIEPSVPAAAAPVANEPQAAASLPPIETIDAASDITAFLAPGVPLELTRAALRRAWSADPTIRDFVGLSENAWDFNAAGGVPGFGSSELREVRELAARVLGELQGMPSADAATPIEAATVASPASTPEPPKSIPAPQHEDDQGKPCEPRPRRHHGAALPQ